MPAHFEPIANVVLISIVGGITRAEYIAAVTRKYQADHVEICSQNAMSVYRSQPGAQILDGCMNTDGIAEEAGKKYDLINGLK